MTGDRGSSFKFNDGASAPIVDQSKLKHGGSVDTQILGWTSPSIRTPSSEDIMAGKILDPLTEYCVVKGFDVDDNLKYLLQEKTGEGK